MPSKHDATGDGVRGPDQPPPRRRLYGIARVLWPEDWSGVVCCHRPYAVWLHWTGKRDALCTSSGAECSCPLLGLPRKWSSWLLAQRPLGGRIWAVKVSQGAALAEATGAYRDANASLHRQLVTLQRIRPGAQGALRLILRGPAPARHDVPQRSDLAAWVHHLYHLDERENDAGRAVDDSPAL